MYFLTELDPNVDVKGSRDPLGFQPIWTALGRQVVPYLTTVTTSLRGFSVLLVGLDLAERVLEAESGSDHDTRERKRVGCFLRFEQLAAYARHAKHNASDIRGIRRVKRRLQEGGTVTIGESDRHQILGEQRTYGLWGLYMSAARGSGLVEGADARLTPRARELVDHLFLRALGKSVLSDVMKRVRDEGRTFEPRGRDRVMATALGNTLGPERSEDERRLMLEALVSLYPDRDTTGGSQTLLWQAMLDRSRSKRFDWSARCTYADVVALRDHVIANHALARSLDAVIAIEPLLATTEVLFNHLVGRRQVKRSDAVRSLQDTWGKGAFRHLRTDAVSTSAGDIAKATDAATPSRLNHMLEGLRSDRLDDVIEALLAQNDAVMRARGGAGWIDHAGAVLRAQLFQRPVDLPARKNLPTAWRNSYFLDALRWIGADISSLGSAPGDD